MSDKQSTTSIKADKAKQLSIPSKHIFICSLPIPLMIVLGLVGNMYGWIGPDNSKANQVTALDLTPPDAKNKVTDADKKYGIPGSSLDAGMQMNDVNSGSGLTFDNSNVNSKMISGDNPNSTGIEANNKNDVAEFAASLGVSSTPKNGLTADENATLSSTDKKKLMQTRTTQQRSKYGREVNQLTSDMYRNPNLEAEYKAEQKRERLAEAQRNKDNQELMGLVKQQMEQRNQMQAQGQQPPMSASVSTGKMAKGKTSRFAKNAKGFESSQSNNESNNNYDVQVYSRNVIQASQREGGNAFFGLNGNKIRNNRPSKVKGAIRAVVHGDGDGINVTNGTSVSIRMTDETQILVQGEPLILPKNTIITGVSQIRGDRISITVKTIRLNNYLYNVNLTAYDLDGQPGLYVPDLRLKTMVNQQVVQNSSQMVNPSYMMMGQGSVGQQVGGQLAVQGVNSLMQTGRSIAQRKLQQPKALIKPNYQILLKSGESPQDNQDQGSDNSDYSESSDYQ